MIDTHCHIHMSDYGLDAKKQLQAAKEKGVETIIVIGEGIEDSRLALDFAEASGVYAAVGLHPHQAKNHVEEIASITNLVDNYQGSRLKAIGECGLDYYYMNSPVADQKIAFIKQIELAKRHNLPLVYHVRGSKGNPRDAFSDFFAIIDNYHSYNGVVHSFSEGVELMQEITRRGLFIGINGIITFTNNQDQITAVKRAPIEQILVETDAPYLTPEPFRGKINSPQYVVDTARHITNLRGDSFAAFFNSTTQNAKRLFSI